MRIQFTQHPVDGSFDELLCINLFNVIFFSVCQNIIKLCDALT